jgi:ADP-heptose:LPS heptosyltransferase/GT2 family glycosyltransferase
VFRRSQAITPASHLPNHIVDATEPPKRPNIFLKVDTPTPDQAFAPNEEIRVSGWLAASEPLTQVIVEIGEASHKATTGVRRPDLAEAYPGVPALAHAGFAVAVRFPALTETSEQRIELKVTATTVGGLSKSETVALVVAVAEKSVPAFFEPMKLMVDQAIVTRSGILKVVGWCICMGRLQAVTVALDDKMIGPAELELEREDVADTWPNYENALSSGFKLQADITAFEGPRTLIVRAKATSGISREVRTQLLLHTPSMARSVGEIHRLECDAATLSTSGDLALKGWAASSEEIDHIAVKLDDEVLGRLERGLERPDVGNRLLSLPQARRSGFAFSARVAPERLKAEHILRFEMVLKDGSIREFVHAVAPQTIESATADFDADPQPAETLLHLDIPVVVDGKAMKDVTNGLSLSGWALAKGGIDHIDVLLNGAAVGKMSCGMRRKDVAQAFPAWDGALLSGFGFSLPRRLLKVGAHRVALEAFGKTSNRARVEFEIQVTAGDEQEGPSSLRTRLSEAERRLHAQVIDKFDMQPWFEIFLRTRGNDVNKLLESIRSIAVTSYGHYSIAVLCPPDCREAVNHAVSECFAALRQRITLLSEQSTDQPPELQAGKPLWHISLEAGDRLAADALFEFAAAINRSPKVDFVYGDDRRLGGEGASHEAFFKPDWSPDLLLSQNYIGRAFCVSDPLLRQCEFDLHEVVSYDVCLQATERAAGVVHVRKVVCEYATPVISPGDRMALQKAVKRRGFDATVENGLTAGTLRVRPRGAKQELVSIIIPTCAAGGLIEKCLTTLREKSSYRNIEVICIDNIREHESPWKTWLRDHADVVVEITEPFNWSRFNNVAAAEASGSLLLFLNDDIEITQPDWLEVLVAIANRDDVGAVGPQLLYPDGRVQHAGLFLSKSGLARHAFRFEAADDPGYFDLALSQRNVIAVTGACLMVRRKTFEELGGFEELHAVINNDLDFCLKCHAARLWNVYTPFASLVHHELASRALLKEDHDAGNFASQWDSVFARGDPFFHPDLDHHSDGFAPDTEPVSLRAAGGPRYRAQSIRRILAVKVDHIGDFITAFPAFRRLKQTFPDASLHVLAAPASRQLAFLEPAIDEVIPFEFFHARSSRGQQEQTEESLRAVRRQLVPYGFDLAVDFRKHAETRMLLKLSGAELTAGFDYQNQFPWLDIALQWEGDPAFVTKRQHISEDLVNLVDAIAAAGVEPQDVIRRDWPKRQVPLITRLNRNGLYARAVVCVHPAAGAELKQWPPSYFASLINLLIEDEDVNVAIVGGADEVDLGEEVMKDVRFPDRVISLVGQFKLDELALFIESCALFVGNDSGPKHIAAALNVPTIGIQSGIVDAKEWGPSGEFAVAIRREVSCAPCYLTKREDCHRDVACLTGLSPGVVFATCQRLLEVKQGIRIS